MDTTTITAPISRVGHQLGDHLPSTSSIAATVADVGSDLAGQITDHVAEIDLAGTVRRGRRAAARVVPWMSVSPQRRIERRWLVVGGLIVAVIAVALIARRRGSDQPEPPARDDWTTGSANGTTPPSDARRPERETASTNA